MVIYRRQVRSRHNITVAWQPGYVNGVNRKTFFYTFMGAIRHMQCIGRVVSLGVGREKNTYVCTNFSENRSQNTRKPHWMERQLNSFYPNRCWPLHSQLGSLKALHRSGELQENDIQSRQLIMIILHHDAFIQLLGRGH